MNIFLTEDLKSFVDLRIKAQMQARVQTHRESLAKRTPPARKAA